MAKTIHVKVCPQCDGDCKPVAGQMLVQCEDCGWAGETAKADETGKQLKRAKVI